MRPTRATQRSATATGSGIGAASGVASALVAELSSSLLAEGRQFCFLYTDLANPTSNKIYERIGYLRVCESAEIEFLS